MGVNTKGVAADGCAGIPQIVVSRAVFLFSAVIETTAKLWPGPLSGSVFSGEALPRWGLNREHERDQPRPKEVNLPQKCALFLVPAGHHGLASLPPDTLLSLPY